MLGLGPLGEFERRLVSLERQLTASAWAAPQMVVLLAFEGEHEDAAAFAADLHQRFEPEAPDLYIEILDFTFPRPSGLKPAWQSPRQWLDYRPSLAELSDLRPDLRPPAAPRPDWISAMPENAPQTHEDAPGAAQ